MKKTILALTLISAALVVLGCQVETEYGIEFRGVFDCSQESYPVGNLGAKLLSGGAYDTKLAEYAGTDGQYIVRIGAGNSLAPSISVTKGLPEGNLIKITSVDVSWEVPKGWSALPKVSRTFNALLQPGSSVIGPVNIMTPELHLAIATNLSKGAYYNLQNIPVDPTLHPLYRPAGGQKCWVGVDGSGVSEAEQCGGYACIPDKAPTSGYGVPTGTEGHCANSCDLEQGCASTCGLKSDAPKACVNNCLPGSKEESGLTCTTPFVGDYVCERGPLPLCNWDSKKFICKDGSLDNVAGGLCRKSCKSTVEDCPGPVIDPGSKRVLYSYECIDNMCLPSVAYSCRGSSCSPTPATNIPSKMVTLNAAITVNGRDTNGNEIKSHTEHYQLNVCRDCLVKYDNASCKPANSGDFLSFEKAISLGCKTPFPYQDYELECAWLEGCNKGFCTR